MELGLRLSGGFSRASWDQRAQVEWKMVLARHINPALRSFASLLRCCIGHLGQQTRGFPQTFLIFTSGENFGEMTSHLP
jgi:hypothetical protein